MLKIKDFVLDDEDLFGLYCYIPTGRDGENHIYKVIGRIQSNCYKDIPAMVGEAYIHKDVEEIVRVIHCGIIEEEIERFRLKDVELVEKC